MQATKWFPLMLTCQLPTPKNPNRNCVLLLLPGLCDAKELWIDKDAAGFFLQLLFAGVVLLFTLDQQRFSKGLIGTACPRSCQASVTPKDFGLVMVRLSLLCALSFAGSVPMFHKADRDVLKA
eukprot:1160432-Pelagomonas_calceolata.AAC.18